MQRVGQSFFSELMLMFIDERPGEGKQPRTAQEIAAKQQEKMLQLGPVLENINEFLTRMVERVVSIMARRRLLPRLSLAPKMALRQEMPPILRRSRDNENAW